MTHKFDLFARAAARTAAAIVVAAFLGGRAEASDLRVEYIVDATLLKTIMTPGNLITFELHSDPTCSSLVATETVDIADPDVGLERYQIKKVIGGPKPPKQIRINFTMTGVNVTPDLYARVTATSGVLPIGGACQPQSAGLPGTVTSVSATAPLSVMNGTSTPAISLGTVPVTAGGTDATTAAGARGNLGAAASGANSDISSLSAATWSVSAAGDASFDTLGVTNGATVGGDLGVSGSLTVGGGNTVAAIRTGTAALDFPNIAPATCSDLTMALSGAADGDAVFLGAPNGSVPASVVMWTWVSSAGTVTVRACNISIGAIDPPSATFRVATLKF